MLCIKNMDFSIFDHVMPSVQRHVPRFDGAPNLYRSQSYGSDAAIFIPDARSFRDQELPGANPNDPASVFNFLVSAFNPTRTMLGGAQLNQLKGDLLAAENAGVQWKFVMVPEPIQNLGVVGAGDRFEGYAAERSDLLRFIKTNDIDNVVFIAADIHGTIVNNLTYQDFPGGPQIPVKAWEITTGSLAFDEPFGPTVVQLAESLGVLPAGTFAFYNSLPAANKEAFIANLINGQLNPLGYDPVGLQGSGVDFNLLAGGFTATNTFGWTEFDIDPSTGLLTVTTFGIDPYNESQINAGILSRTPRIVSQFQVQPEVPEPASLSLMALATLGLAARRRGRTLGT